MKRDSAKVGGGISCLHPERIEREAWRLLLVTLRYSFDNKVRSHQPLIDFPPQLVAFFTRHVRLGRKALPGMAVLWLEQPPGI
jgi:hypothetical protein